MLFTFHEQSILKNRKVDGKETQFVNAALERLKAGYPVQVKNLRFEESGRAAVGWDGEVTLKTAQGIVSYLFEVKAHLIGSKLFYIYSFGPRLIASCGAS